MDKNKRIISGGRKEWLILHGQKKKSHMLISFVAIERKYGFVYFEGIKWMNYRCGLKDVAVKTLEKSPICKRDGFGQLCFGIGARFCPKNSAKSINNQNPEKKDVIEYGDYVELFRREKTKDIVLQIPKISLFNKLADSLVGKKLNDEVLFNNNLWIIKTIDKREEKMPQFVIHKKNQKTHID